MTVIHKTISAQNLTNYQTWLVDTDPTSKYFQLSQFPDVLTAGRNAFLINGSPELVNSTAVKIEVVDVNGRVVFSEPIRNYIEGLSRLVSIEIYENTPDGMGIITILGHVSRDADGNLPPSQFVDKYNVKWQKKILIAPRKQNTTTIRMADTPVISVSEILNPLRITSQSIQLLTASATEIVQGTSLFNSVRSGDPTPNIYIISSSKTPFVKSMESGVFRASVNGTPFTSSIAAVINNSTLKLTYGPTGSGLYTPFFAPSYSIQYTGSPGYVVTESTRSFADITINQLSTLTGNIYKAKVLMTHLNSPGVPELISDTNIVAAEMLVTSSYVAGQQKVRTGYFSSSVAIGSQWVIGSSSLSASYNPQ